MRSPHPIAVLPFAAAAALAAPVAAQPAEPPGFEERLVLETGRFPHPAPSPDRISFSLRGEYQLRFRAMSDLPLQAPTSDPGATTLGQNKYLYHWLRISPRLQYRDKVAIVGQIDVPRGLVVGDTTVWVDRVRDAQAESRLFGVHPRWLYLELVSAIGLFRVGQQGSHWGMGILANDGDHPALFGDYQRGAIVERVLFATTPLGRGTPLTIGLAGDLVFEDNTADLLGDDIEGDEAGGDRAWQGVAAVALRGRDGDIGVYGVIRTQSRDRAPPGGITPFTEELTVGVVDLAGSFRAAVPGADAWVYGHMEGAVILGSTTFVRSSYGAPLDPSAERLPEEVRSFGGAATLGAVHAASRGRERWGRVVTEVEVGYASGDADPYDGVSRRFTFDPSHNVGLVLFDHVLAWKTARAGTLAQDPSVVARPTPGAQLLPSKGGVFGAAYVNPRFVYRPVPALDLKAGAVIAQTTADFVDPYHAGALGEYQNYDGGDDHHHDLGLELDFGVEGRVVVDGRTTFQIGAEGGVLFPGHAFDGPAGDALPNQYLLNTKLGFQY